MGKHRILYQVVLISSVILYALYPLWISWYLLVLVLLLIPFDLILSLPGMLNRRIKLSAPKMLRQGMDGTLTVLTHAKKQFPAGRIKLRLREISEDGIERFHLKCDAQHGSRYELAINTSRSGYVAFDFNRFWTTSLLGLFSLPLAISGRTGVLIVPKPQIPPRAVVLPRVAVLRPERSGAFSEEHDLRPFRQGDPLNSIHWKLSAKHDSLIVREPLRPMPHSRLIHIADWSGAHERDLILGRLWWVSEYLLKRSLHYFVRFGEKGPVEQITKEGDLVDYLSRILDDNGSASLAAATPPARFTWVFRVDAKEHLRRAGH